MTDPTDTLIAMMGDMEKAAAARNAALMAAFDTVEKTLDDALAALAKMRWQPIETAPCDDTLALVYFPNECYGIQIQDLDHDSDPQWWKERGATHWKPLPETPENEKWPNKDQP